MQGLSGALRKEFICVGLERKSKTEAIRELVRCLAQGNVVADEQAFLDAVMARENIQSTGVGGGVAIPHARVAGIRCLSVAMGHYEDGVDFGSLDGKPVFLVFLVAAPADAAKAYLQTVAKVAQLLKASTYKDRLLNARNAEEIADIILEFDREHPQDILVKRTEDGRVIHTE
jgi:PTS system fructose-specific IIC component